MSTMYHNKRYLELNMDQEISCSVLFCSVYNYSIFREKKGKQCFVHLKTDTIKSVELRR